MRIGIGIDWGADEHEVCAVMEGRTRATQRWRVPHRGADIEALFDKLFSRESLDVAPGANLRLRLHESLGRRHREP